MAARGMGIEVSPITRAAVTDGSLPAGVMFKASSLRSSVKTTRR
jgi:hypothetical protein